MNKLNLSFNPIIVKKTSLNLPFNEYLYSLYRREKIIASGLGKRVLIIPNWPQNKKGKFNIVENKKNLKKLLKNIEKNTFVYLTIPRKKFLENNKEEIVKKLINKFEKSFNIKIIDLKFCYPLKNGNKIDSVVYQYVIATYLIEKTIFDKNLVLS